MASVRHRHEPVEEDPGVIRARNKLKNILQQQKFRSRWGEVDEDDRVCSGNDDCDNCILNDLSGSQQKPFQRNSKKDGDKKTSLVCKMFERSVDLSQFPENTPLYPICKAWMQNKPKQESSVNKVGGDDNPQVMKTNSHVQVFPKPKPLASRYDKFGNKISTFPLPPALSTKDSKAILSRIISNPDVDEDSLPSPATLFQNHMDRWVQVREHWRREGARREKRYEASYAIFRRLHQEVEDKT